MISIFKKKKLKYYKSCSTLSIYSFYKILEAQDLRWLVFDYNENSELELNDAQNEELSVLWKDIFNEYTLLKNDNKVTDNLRKRALIANLQNRLYFGTTILQLIVKNPTSRNLDRMVDELAKWRFRIDKEKPLYIEIDKITKQLKSLRTRLKIEISKYDAQLKKDENKEKVSIESQTVNITNVLGLRFPIIAKETSVAQWISYCKNAEKIIRDGRKDRNN